MVNLRRHMLPTTLCHYLLNHFSHRIIIALSHFLFAERSDLSADLKDLPGIRLKRFMSRRWPHFWSNSSVPVRLRSPGTPQIWRRSGSGGIRPLASWLQSRRRNTYSNARQACQEPRRWRARKRLHGGQKLGSRCRRSLFRWLNTTKIATNSQARGRPCKLGQWLHSRPLSKLERSLSQHWTVVWIFR